VPRWPSRGRPVGVSDPETRAHVAGEASAAAAEVSGPPAVEADPTAAAFFDVDNTMMMGASLFWFARGLAARKYFKTRDLARFVWQQAKFRVAGNESAEDMHSIRESALGFVAGRPVDEIVQAGEDIYDELMADRIWGGTRQLAQKHLDAGQRVWLVTATPVEVAEVIAARLGLSGALGSIAEQVDGVYTGRMLGELLHGPEKALAVRALAQEHGLDLSACSAYSDSANDIPMLSLVGDPCAINPDARLRDHAHRHGWRIRDYRTGRKVAKHSLQALAATALTGALGAAGARRRRR